jgi:4-diphosphocytidyl-2-C-methyl-D-erythritol kinase
MTTLTGRAPAKLNLFLHILGRRSDGYHDLQTVFQLVDLCDEIRVELTPDGRIERAPLAAGSLLADVPPEQDLAIRAARLLQTRARPGQGAVIAIDKRIPTGGGLGGGSSDAATVLRLLNELWALRLPSDELAALGLTLGADVPVFVRGRTAWGEGRGECLTPIHTPPRWFVIVHPAVAVSTASVFADPELTRSTPPLRMRDFGAVPLRNDCEPVVRRRHPPVAAALDWLAQFAPAQLTGTGACVFAAFPDEAAARAVAGKVAAPWTAWVARSMEST